MSDAAVIGGYEGVREDPDRFMLGRRVSGSTMVSLLAGDVMRIVTALENETLRLHEKAEATSFGPMAEAYLRSAVRHYDLSVLVGKVLGDSE